MQVLWTLPALNDLEDISDCIAEDNPVAAYELVQAIYQKTETVVGEFPETGRFGRVNGTREFVVPGTAYVVAYQVRVGGFSRRCFSFCLSFQFLEAEFIRDSVQCTSYIMM